MSNDKKFDCKHLTTTQRIKIENAMKYNITNKKVEIKTLVEDNVEKIIISDSGIGISAENINKIFESFYRVDPSRSRKISGAGLGLSIVKSIIENTDGK